MRQELKDNLVCKLLLVPREGLMETQGTGVLSKAAVIPQSLAGYPGKARICPDLVP